MNKKGKSGIRAAVTAVVVFCMIICASQCFAQSSEKSASAEANKNRQYTSLIDSVFDFVQHNYVDEVDPKVLYEGALRGMMSAMKDPYTTYMDTDMMTSLNDTTQGEFGGVGLTISKPTENTPDKPAYVEVVSPVEDTPGWKAGIKSGDLIIQVNGKETPPLTMEQVLSSLRGKAGEKVSVVIRSGTVDFPVTLTRAVIEVPTVKYGMIGDVAYLRIIEFTPQTPQRVQDGIDSFKKANVKYLIIDVRDNPGGLITSVADVADKFIDSGTIVSTKSRFGTDEVFTATARKTTMPHIPVVLLLNKGSASAAEILSGALKDTHLAYLVGERSYGKGSVQQPIPLPNNDGIKLTIARYYSPSDTNIDKIGIPPDREVKMPLLSDDEQKTYLDMTKAGVVASYISRHPHPAESEIAFYAMELQKNYKLDLRTLRRIIRLESQRIGPAPLYDLDYDIQLQAALDILHKEDFNHLMQTTKTLKELQQEAQAAAAVAKK